MKSEQRVSWRRKLVFSLVPLAVLLLVLELGARAVCVVRFAPFHTSIAVQGRGRMASDPTTIFGNRPYYLEFDHTGQYSDLGVRVVPGEALRTPPRAEDELLVILLGGSAMAGMGSVHVGDWLKITGVSTHPKAHSIDGFLEEYLRQQMPGRKIRVLNAAVNCSTLLQSRFHARRLGLLDPQWIISMDGYNDPRELAQGQTSEDWIRNFWKGFHYFRFPYRQARWLMPRSAAAYLVGEYLFYTAGVTSHTHRTIKDPELMRHWRDFQVGVLPPSPDPMPDHERAVASYLQCLSEFHSELEADDRAHLLLVQPEVTARDRSCLGSDEERAVFNYTLNRWGGRTDRFMADVHREVENLGVPEIISMDSVSGWRDWVFVDYCHFTTDANRRVAHEIGRHILSQGSFRPFAGE